MGAGGRPAAAGPSGLCDLCNLPDLPELHLFGQGRLTHLLLQLSPQQADVALRRIETMDGDVANELRYRMQRAWCHKNPNRPRRGARGPYRKSRTASPVCNADWQAVTEESEPVDCQEDMLPEACPPEEAFDSTNTQVDNFKEDTNSAADIDNLKDGTDSAAERGTKRAASTECLQKNALPSPQRPTTGKEQPSRGGRAHKARAAGPCQLGAQGDVRGNR